MLKLYENAVFALFIQKQITEAFCDSRLMFQYSNLHFYLYN